MVCDDLSFGGKDDAKHGGIPKQVLDCALANNVKFNLNKFQLSMLVKWCLQRRLKPVMTRSKRPQSMPASDQRKPLRFSWTC